MPWTKVHRLVHLAPNRRQTPFSTHWRPLCNFQVTTVTLELKYLTSVLQSPHWWPIWIYLKRLVKKTRQFYKTSPGLFIRPTRQSGAFAVLTTSWTRKVRNPRLQGATSSQNTLLGWNKVIRVSGLKNRLITQRWTDRFKTKSISNLPAATVEILFKSNPRTLWHHQTTY